MGRTLRRSRSKLVRPYMECLMNLSFHGAVAPGLLKSGEQGLFVVLKMPGKTGKWTGGGRTLARLAKRLDLYCGPCGTTLVTNWHIGRFAMIAARVHPHRVERDQAASATAMRRVAEKHAAAERGGNEPEQDMRGFLHAEIGRIASTACGLNLTQPANVPARSVCAQ